MSRWQEAQKSEKKCWEKIKGKFMDEKYFNKKTKFWNKILEKINSRVKIDPKKSMIDIGCGPSGIVLLFKNNKNLVCIDPLINEYKKLNPFLRKYSAKYINSKIENFNISKKFDYVFAFNSLDHVDSIEKSLEKIKKLVKKGGFFFLSVNCHNFKFMQKILIKTSFIFDNPHPHQYILKDYIAFLKEGGFNPIEVINLDDEVNFMSSEKNKPSLKKNLYNLTRPYIFLNIFGIPRYAKKNKKSIYSNQLIIAKPK